MKTARLCLTALLLALPAKPQEPATPTEISFERFTRAGKESLRDSAELPMRLTVDFSATDLTGRVRKHRKGKFDYDFHGFNPRSNNGGGLGKLDLHGSRRRFKEGGTIAAITMLPAVLVAPGVEHRLKMKSLNSPQPDLFVAEFAPQEDSLGTTTFGLSTEKPVPQEKSGPGEKCQTSGWMQKAYLFNNICLDRAQVQLEKNDLSVKSFAWDTGGLPVQGTVDYLGEANITGYHVDMDFQKATLPGDPKPFVVPWHVTVTVITDKGKLLMSGEFALKK
ncbi:MAG TPA: hypothetical protein VGJ51_10430 [Candidatus Angelobacter sp.]